jgi:hypothetical protein
MFSHQSCSTCCDVRPCSAFAGSAPSGHSSSAAGASALESMTWRSTLALTDVAEVLATAALSAAAALAGAAGGAAMLARPRGGSAGPSGGTVSLTLDVVACMPCTRSNQAVSLQARVESWHV